MTILQDMYLLLLQEAHLVGVTPNHYPAIWAIADVLAETTFASVRTLKKQQ